jgi:hypothetical protein
VNSGWREKPSSVARVLVGRAAVFHLEAAILRQRAGMIEEPVVREQYLALAERWSRFAAGLEAEAIATSI